MSLAPQLEVSASRDMPTGSEQSSGIVGHLDAISGNRVFGWAWDRLNPAEPVEVLVHAGDRLLGSVAADRMRADLRDGGIGDGRHAFEFSLPETETIDPTAIRLFTRRVGDAALIPIASNSGEADSSSANAWEQMCRAVARLEASNRILHRNLQAVLLIVKDGSQSAEAQPAVSAQQNASVDEANATGEALRQQLQGIEVFLVRFDATLREFDASLGELRKRRLERPSSVLGVMSVLLLISVAMDILRFFN